MNDTEPIIVAGRFINVGTKCPHCNKWNKPPIKVVECHCEHCNMDYKTDISVENKEVYEAETIKDYLWIMMKRFQAQDEVRFHVRDEYLHKVLFLESMLKIWGVEVERKFVNSEIKKTGKMATVNEVTFRRSEELTYFIKNSPFFRE